MARAPQQRNPAACRPTPRFRRRSAHRSDDGSRWETWSLGLASGMFVLSVVALIVFTHLSFRDVIRSQPSGLPAAAQ